MPPDKSHVLKHTAIERRRCKLPLRGTGIGLGLLVPRSNALQGVDSRRPRPIAVCFSTGFLLTKKRLLTARSRFFHIFINYFGVNDVPQPQLFWTLGLRYFQPPSKRFAVL